MIDAPTPGFAGNETLSFELLRLPDELSRIRVDDPRLEGVVRAALADAAKAEDARSTVIAGVRNGRTALLAPWRAQTIELPIRLGEKVVWAPSLPSIRLTPMAQEGVLALDDALALFGWLRRSMPDRAVVLTDASTESPLHAAVAQAQSLGYRITMNEPVKHWFHRFAADYPEFFKARSGKHKYRLRNNEKIFVDRFGDEFELREYRQPDEVAEFLAAASAINRKTYQFRLFGESVDNDERSLLAGRRAAAAGSFHSFVLWHGATPLAFVLGHRQGGEVIESRKTGYDPDWSDFAPGINCHILMLRRLYASDRPQLLDFGSGDALYKRLFSNESRQSANPVLIPQRPLHVLAYGLHGVSVAINASAVRLLDRVGLKEWIKRWMRRAG